MERFDSNWIESVNKEFGEIADKINRNYRRVENSRLCHKLGATKYEKSAKGKIAKKRAILLHHLRRKNPNLCYWERKQIVKFYHECPRGYEVDHIIPLSRGGPHSLSNLQWITKKTNARKATFIAHAQDCPFPHCKINIEEYYLNF